MKKYFLVIMVFAIAASNSQAKQYEDDFIDLGGHVTVNLKPDNEIIDPFKVVIDLKIPHRINSVGEAIEYLLSKSGYSLYEGLDYPEMYVLLNHEVPEQQRNLKNIRLESAINVIAGSIFKVGRDEVRRVVYFYLPANVKEELKGEYLEKQFKLWKRKQTAQSSLRKKISNNGNSANWIEQREIRHLVKPGESLSSIIYKYKLKNSDYTLSQLMVEIYNQNRKAFMNNNMNQLRKGALLKFSINNIKLSKKEAIKVEKKHNKKSEAS